MRTRRRHALILVFLAAAFAPGRARAAGAKDYYLSVPAIGGIVKVDATTLQATPFAGGLGIPFYGVFTENGDFYVPDRLFGAVLRIDPAGVVHLVTGGGYLNTPVALVREPGAGLLVTDLYTQTLVRVGFDGTQTLIHDFASSGGLLDSPGGLDVAPDGSIYVANNLGNTIVRVDPQGNATLFSASPLIQSPGGVAIDGAGNMFVAMYDGNRVVRFRLDTAEAEVFAEDAALFNKPNDLKLARSGGLLTTTRFSNLLRIDALGAAQELFKDTALGEVDGVAVPEDATKCSGRFLTYGQGVAGSGGFVPRMRAVYSPCPGATVALEWRAFLGGAPALLVLGTKPGNLPFAGGTLLVDLAPPAVLVPLTIPGSGPGGGDFALQFTLDSNPAFAGAHLYFQTLAADSGAAQGVSLSNGLEEIIGL